MSLCQSHNVTLYQPVRAKNKELDEASYCHMTTILWDFFRAKFGPYFSILSACKLHCTECSFHDKCFIDTCNGIEHPNLFSWDENYYQTVSFYGTFHDEGLYGSFLVLENIFRVTISNYYKEMIRGHITHRRSVSVVFFWSYLSDRTAVHERLGLRCTLSTKWSNGILN